MGNYSYELGLKVETIDKNASKDEVKDFLHSMTDNDFNGTTSKDYFVERMINGKTESISKLDNAMMDFDDRICSTASFIENVLLESRSDNYYHRSEVNILEVGDTIVVAVAYID